MTIRITHWLMTSDISPEFAERIQTRFGAVWLLSWLPGRSLSFDQARAGMAVDEFVSDPSLIDDHTALARAHRAVALLGLVWEQVVYTLANRIETRILEAQTLQGGVAEPTSYRGGPGAIHSDFSAA